MCLADFFTTRILANLFGMKGFERDLFFAMSYSNRSKNKKQEGHAADAPSEPHSVEKTTGTSPYNPKKSGNAYPIGGFQSVQEINSLIRGNDAPPPSDKDRVRAASAGEFKDVLTEIAKKKLEQKKKQKPE